MYRVEQDPMFAMAESFFLDGGSRLDNVKLASLALVSEQRSVACSNSRFPTCYGPEFVAKAPRGWLGRIGVKTLYIEPGSSERPVCR